MKTIELNEDQIKLVYKNAPTEVRAEIRVSLGEDFSKVLPIMERVKTLDDALAELSTENNPVKAREHCYLYRVEGTADLQAYLDLRVIVAALNEGWEPNINPVDELWYPRFSTIEENATERADCALIADGFFLVCDGAVKSGGTEGGFHTALPQPLSLAFKSEKIAKYAGSQFVEFYAKLYGYKK